jgi:hypothetical protein
MAAAPVKVDLPQASPFFGKETAAKAAERLKKTYIDHLKDAPSGSAAKLATALQALIQKKKADRAPMAIGVAILSGKDSPYFVSANPLRVCSVYSIAKLALLYAAFQLRADLAVIGNSAGLATAKPDYPSRVTDLIAGVRAAFTRSNDPALASIGRSQNDFPKLARIFNLQAYLGADPPNRFASTLQFVSDSGGDVDRDEYPFNGRLMTAIRPSGDTEAASCICDIGLPYIRALMNRTGFGSLRGKNKPGLWLSWYYDDEKQIKKDRNKRSGRDLPPWERDLQKSQRDAVTGEWTEGARMTDYEPVRGTASMASGHVGTAVGIATFLTEMYAGRLVDAESSTNMLDFLVGAGGYFQKKFRGVGAGSIHSKVGYYQGHFCDSAIIDSQSIQLAATPRPGNGGSGDSSADGGSSSAKDRSVQWIGVALDALFNGQQGDDGGILEDLGADLETAVADNT